MRFAIVAALALAIFAVGATAQADPTPPPKHHLTLPLLHKPTSPPAKHAAPLAKPGPFVVTHPVVGPPPHPVGAPMLHPLTPHPLLASHAGPPHPPGGLPVCHPGAKLCGHSCISAKLTCHK